jgi:radical SAM protein with 4Fe4S-binding SPASM domain
MASIFVKPLNAVLSGSSFMLSTISGRSCIAGMPVSISFELTNHCNLGCPECISGSGMMKRAKGYMDLALFNKVVKELKPYLYYINLYFQGEPMLHKQFFSFAEQTGKIFTVVSTNGHYLTSENAEMLVRSGISKLIVSLDGMDQSTYSRYRKGGDLSRVIQGISNIAATRKKTGSKMKLEIQFLVNKFNEHQIIMADNFAREVGADLKLKSMQIITDSDGERWMPTESKFRRYKKIDGKLSLKSKIPDRCMRLWFNPVVTWDGKVVPCCFDKDAEFVMGDLNKESFRSIWNGRPYSRFRNMVLTARKEIHICRNCTSGMKGVKY